MPQAVVSWSKVLVIILLTESQLTFLSCKEESDFFSVRWVKIMDNRRSRSFPSSHLEDPSRGGMVMVYDDFTLAKGRLCPIWIAGSSCRFCYYCCCCLVTVVVGLLNSDNWELEDVGMRVSKYYLGSQWKVKHELVGTVIRQQQATTSLFLLF